MGNGSSARAPFPGIPATADGATAVAYVETHVTQGACAYPITPSTGMGQAYEVAVANGATNLWGEPLVFLEPESEHSSASACEGFAAAGGRVSNFTSGQGLILMKEVLYTIAGKRLPVVFHIGARALTSHSLNVHAGHDDVMGVADTGWGMLFAMNAQEAADLALIARRAAESSRTPFFNVQDGFVTTHTLESLLLPEPELMERFVGPPAERLRPLFDPYSGVQSGVVQNQDSYMKGKIAQRFYYDHVREALQEAMTEFTRLTGRSYGLVRPYRLDDAEYAVVAMGSAAETAMATVDWLRQRGGPPVGVLAVTSFRPFPGPEVVEALRGVRSFSVLERLDVPLAQSNPLTAEIKASFADAASGAEGYPEVDRIPEVYSGTGGLGGRDIRPRHIVAIVENMQARGRRLFTVGISHPLAIHSDERPDIRPAGAFSMRGHSVGGFGSITTNKLIAEVAAALFGVHVQAYPKYGSEKKGLPTNYFLTLADAHIRTHCELEWVEFLVVNDVNAFRSRLALDGLQEGGTIFVQSSETTPEGVWNAFPGWVQDEIRRRRIRVLALDTAAIARSVASSPDLVVRMQGIVLLGVFLRATPYARQAGIGREQLFKRVEQFLRKQFGRRSEQVVRENLECVRRGYDEVFEVP
ncbi:MAG TPA: 2-oxoacid:acceptor oxidoreductase family protein, partial [Dehalococcoidia bacterium]|nr:2-oxoacid:acceptor oxidoreductase family protein [Dehalococcoidia bacterium]